MVANSCHLDNKWFYIKLYVASIRFSHNDHWHHILAIIVFSFRILFVF